MNRPQLFARLILAGIAALVLTLALSFAGCRSARPAPVAAIQSDTTKHSDNNRSASPSTPKPGILSGIGSVFSTPAGIARRQAVRLARAGVPKKLGKGAVYAPKATEVVNAFKPRAAVINADSGAIVTAIGKNKASAATAPNATATTTTSKGISYWWLLIPAAGLALWLYRKTFPFA